MEGVEHGSGYEGRLIVNPKLLNGLVCVGDDDSLVSHSMDELDRLFQE